MFVLMMKFLPSKTVYHKGWALLLAFQWRSGQSTSLIRYLSMVCHSKTLQSYAGCSNVTQNLPQMFQQSAAWPIFLLLREQGPSVQKPDTEPIFKPLLLGKRVYKATGCSSVFLLYKDQGWTENSNFSCSQVFSSACTIHKKHFPRQVPPSSELCSARAYCTGQLPLLPSMGPFSDFNQRFAF